MRRSSRKRSNTDPVAAASGQQARGRACLDDVRQTPALNPAYVQHQFESPALIQNHVAPPDEAPALPVVQNNCVVPAAVQNQVIQNLEAPGQINASPAGYARCNLRLKDTAVPTISLEKTNTETSSSAKQENNKYEMPSSNDKPSKQKECFQFSCDVDLDNLIGSAIADHCDLDTCSEAVAWDNKVKTVQGQTNQEERRKPVITQILKDCHFKMDVCRDTLEETLKEEDAKLEAAEKASKQPSEIIIVNTDDETDDKDQTDIHDDDDDDDDDDVQFIRKTYVPTFDFKLGACVSAMKAHPMPSATNAAQNFLHHKPGTVGPYDVSSQANQGRMEKLFLEEQDVNKIEIGGNVLGRRYGDVWEKAVVMEIMGQDKDVSEVRKYRVKFEDGKIMSKLSRQIAFSDSINKPVTVGTRILALYKDDETDEALYAGIVAEGPTSTNKLRYLVFFDNGCAQYCSSREIHKVFYQSKNVWDDLHPDLQDFVKDYLSQFPERKMVRLHKGHTVKTEWNGRWWVARVEEVDASLVRMIYRTDKSSEWIYRGSTRLEPLYTALVNAEANRNVGKVKRHNLTMPGSKKPILEYTRNSSTVGSPDKADKKKNVAKIAKMSTTPNTHKRPVSSINSSGGTNKNNSSISGSSSTTNRNSKRRKDTVSVIQKQLKAREDDGSPDKADKQKAVAKKGTTLNTREISEGP